MSRKIKPGEVTAMMAALALRDYIPTTIATATSRSVAGKRNNRARAKAARAARRNNRRRK